MDIIAFYLPQYHPTPNNDLWWGKGFTEWTNVAKAKPLFPGHYQPKIPADLGFYDLRLPVIREQQAVLAKEAGISAFCYYHYWFGNGHQELELPINEVVKLGEPDFPFCLCWANDTWSQKMWNKDGSVVGKKDLAIQQYLGHEDNILHFKQLLHIFKDKRYFKIDGRLVFAIYRPLDFKDVNQFINDWNELAKENGLPPFFFIGYSIFPNLELEKVTQLGFDAIISCRLDRNTRRDFGWFIRKSISVLLHTPRRISYKRIYHSFVTEFEEKDNVFPTLIPNWDHTPRSGTNGDLYTDCRPELFERHAIEVLRHVVKKKPNRQIAFLKSWNEWGEGNYMEPDLRYGKGYIKALRNAISSVVDNI